MASSVLAVRAGVGSWSSIKYLLTRGLDFGAAVAPVDDLIVSFRHSVSPVVLRNSESSVPQRASVSPVIRRTAGSEVM